MLFSIYNVDFIKRHLYCVVIVVCVCVCVCVESISYKLFMPNGRKHCIVTVVIDCNYAIVIE